MSIESGATRERLVTGPFIAVTTALFLQFMFVGMVIVIIPRFVELQLGRRGTRYWTSPSSPSPERPSPTSRDRPPANVSDAVLMRAGALMCAGGAPRWRRVTGTSVYVFASERSCGVGEAIVFVAAC